jgi:hypothetical protein
MDLGSQSSAGQSFAKPRRTRNPNERNASRETTRGSHWAGTRVKPRAAAECWRLASVSRFCYCPSGYRADPRHGLPGRSLFWRYQWSRKSAVHLTVRTSDEIPAPPDSRG